MTEYGGAENIEVIINPDGTVIINMKDFAERDSQPELTELLNLLNKQGMETTVRNTRQEYTGEYHKHTHSNSDHLHVH